MVPQVHQGQHHDVGHQETTVTTVAAILLILVVTPVARGFGIDTLPWQMLLILPPAMVGTTIVIHRRTWRLTAPLIALAISTALSAVFALLLDVPWWLYGPAAIPVIANFGAWPQWRSRAAAHVLLSVIGLAPPMILVLVQITGIANPLGALWTGQRLSFGFTANLNGWSFLWSVLALGVLAHQGSRWARPVTGISLVCLGAVGSRAEGLVALGCLVMLLYRDRWLGWRSAIRLQWVWALFLIAWLPRVASRFLGVTGPEAVAGLSMSGRLRIWRTYVEEGGHFILTGGGLGRVRELAASNPTLHGLTPHNEYLWIAIDLGIMGVIIILGGWAVALWARRHWMLPRHPELLVPGLALPAVMLVSDPLLALTFAQPYLILLAASVPFASDSSGLHDDVSSDNQQTSPAATRSQ